MWTENIDRLAILMSIAILSAVRNPEEEKRTAWYDPLYTLTSIVRARLCYGDPAYGDCPQMPP